MYVGNFSSHSNDHLTFSLPLLVNKNYWLEFVQVTSQKYIMCVAIALQMIFLTLAIALSSELQPTDMDSCIATTILLLQY